MFRKGIELRTEDRVNFVLNHGALGDVITSLPAVIQARRTHGPDMTLAVWAPSWVYDLVKVLLEPYGEFEYRIFEEFPVKGADRRKMLELGPIAANSFHGQPHTRNRVDMVDFAFSCLLDARPESDDERNYPNAAPVGNASSPVHGKYVVFAAGATSSNKTFLPEIMGPVIDWVYEAGYLPVVVGSKTSHVKAETGPGKFEPLPVIDNFDGLPYQTKNKCVDLRNTTTLLELRDICAGAQAVVGVDGGTLHLAGTTDVNIVYGLTSVSPKHRGIVRDGIRNKNVIHVVPRDLACAGCQSNWTLMFGHDFRDCAYQDDMCTRTLCSEDFIEALKDFGLQENKLCLNC